LKGGLDLYNKLKRFLIIPFLALSLLFASAVSCGAVSASSTLTLTATPNPSGNYVALNWSNSDKSEPYSYMLYSKSANESTFQSIPAKSTVSVLNIYPDVAPSISFVNWKGQNYTLPQSAALKMWMETPNGNNPKGYGQGLISVDTVSISNFNLNPDSYLKNSNGTYKYDVLYFGAWDSNNNQDLSAAAETSTDFFVRTGRGVCFGHDTLVSNNTIAMPNFFKLAHYVNIETIYNYTTLGSTQIAVSKKGLLTNYPWMIGDTGTILSVPMSHSNSQIAMGDIWMSYQAPYTYSGGAPQSDPSGAGSNNFYLSTWCNCALIQTGHSNGAATPDEQRVTANVLFYLAQITVDTSWNDHKGQDVNAPNAPSISGVTHNTNHTQYTVNYSSQDNATSYQYYVEATGQNDGIKYDSPVVATGLESGLKGYSILIDGSPFTVPDGTVTTTAGSYTFSRPSGSGFYVHVAAVDNVGNISAVSTYHVDELVSITHPVSVSYSIDPNSSVPFSSPEIQIENNSSIPVSVTVLSLGAAAGGTLNFTDVDPSSKQWKTLDLADSKKYFALGIGLKNASGWNDGYNSNTYWSSDSASMLIGTLNPAAKGFLSLTADFGMAFDKTYTVNHALIMIFQIT
jgi:hypothetical protein